MSEISVEERAALEAFIESDWAIADWCEKPSYRALAIQVWKFQSQRIATLKMEIEKLKKQQQPTPGEVR